jgi:hypothetical protein
MWLTTNGHFCVTFQALSGVIGLGYGLDRCPQVRRELLVDRVHHRAGYGTSRGRGRVLGGPIFISVGVGVVAVALGVGCRSGELRSAEPTLQDVHSCVFHGQALLQ